MHPNGQAPEPPDDDPDNDGDDDGGLPGPRVAYSANWKTVLAVDAAMGLVVVAAGLVAMVVWVFWLGAALALVGCLYVAMVVRRGDRWRRLRADAGL